MSSSTEVSSSGIIGASFTHDGTSEFRCVGICTPRSTDKSEHWGLLHMQSTSNPSQWVLVQPRDIGKTWVLILPKADADIEELIRHRLCRPRKAGTVDEDGDMLRAALATLVAQRQFTQMWRDIAYAFERRLLDINQMADVRVPCD